MTKFTLFIVIILLLTGCNQAKNQLADENSRQDLLPEPDKAERLKYETIKTLKKSGCFLTNPDTSVCGIIIRNEESATAVIGNKNKADSVEQYHFYSKLEEETLTLTQHPGDGTNQISLFTVQYSNKADYGYRRLPVNTFASEKGIRLGMTKKQIVERLGYCYAGLDSTKNYIELYYSLELPEDSKTKLLRRQNIPMYYASYKLWDNKLETFEFGFAYP